MNNGGRGDGHSSSSAKWRRNNFHQSIVSNGCDLVGGVVASGKFDALHVEHKTLLEKKTTKIGIPFLLFFFGMA
jgi:FAD synthase